MTQAAATGGERLQLALDATTGSVTGFLEAIAHEPIDAHVVSQVRGALHGSRGETAILRRCVLLVGRASQRQFVYAATTVFIDALPESAVRRLETSSDPIGRVLAHEGLEVQRTVMAWMGAQADTFGATHEATAATVLARRYRLGVGDAVAMEVREWFLPDSVLALDAIADRTDAPVGEPA